MSSKDVLHGAGLMPAKCNLDKIDDITYSEFFTRFLLPNQLCIFSKEFTKSWKSCEDWVEKGKPNWKFLSERFGDAVVPVANCGKERFHAHEKENMKLREFLVYWRNHVQCRDSRCLYLKDWHFCKEFPEYEAYKVPLCFTSDWLNEYWDQKNDGDMDDYRFVYMGPKGSWTPFHADVFRSYSWSANICGRKKWIIYPPGEEQYLCDIHGNLPFDITSDEIYDPGKFPQYFKASGPIVVIQNEGEVIFIPSGWHHQVINLEDTISINHNWINSCGLKRMWKHLQCELKQVERSIDDCKSMDGWNEQCQLILKASVGIDYLEFLKFMESIADKRINFLEWKCKSKKGSVLTRDALNVFGDHRCSKMEDVTNADEGDGHSTKRINSNESCTSLSTPVSIKDSADRKLKDVFHTWLNAVRRVRGSEKYNELDYCRFDLQSIVNCVEELRTDATLQKLEDGVHTKIASELLTRCCGALKLAEKELDVVDVQCTS